MSLARVAAKSGIWFAGFSGLSQLFSLSITIIVARILMPEDYGLMAMSSILTGYAQIFSEMGLGAAIIQKKELTDEDLSSLFWFCMMVGVVFAVISIGLAYPTAWIFDEPRVIPITQLISVLFIIGAVQIVPSNLLRRAVRFKEIGIIQLTAVVVSSASMLGMAKAGFGVWTLIWGTIIQRIVSTVLVVIIAKWHPALHFQPQQAWLFARFGINVAGARSMGYLLEAGINTIIGKVLGAQALGYYSFAMRLAKLPNDKIMPIINQVSFPVLSRYQDEAAKTHDLYLQLTQYLAIIVFPVYMGGAVFGEEVIQAVLGEQWVAVTSLFQMLCLAQLVSAISLINGVIHTAQGRPHWNLRFSIAVIIPMLGAMFIAAQYGIDELAGPWLAVYLPAQIAWTVITLHTLRVSAATYLMHIVPPLVGAVSVMLAVLILQPLLPAIPFVEEDSLTVLIQIIGTVTILYGAYLVCFERERLREIWCLRK